MPFDHHSQRVALFVPCYIDQLYPDVAWAALELLEAHGVRADVSEQQTCCGQALINTGAVAAAQPLGRRFAATFADYDYVVCPSSSCTATLHRQVREASGQRRPVRVLELCQFLVDVVGVVSIDVAFPYRVALHESCHGLRELGFGRPSELGGGAAASGNPGRQLLSGVKELRLVEPARADECCGFGGSFCIKEPEVSTRMGDDRLDDFARAGAQVVTSADMSCLMHLGGLMQRQGRPLSVMHIAQILVGRPVPAAVAPRART